jgi:hypothetical protein
MTEERALVGWQQIADFLNWSYTKTASRRKEWEAHGVIFHTAFGKPPNRRIYVSAFPSVIQKWIAVSVKSGKKLI